MPIDSNITSAIILFVLIGILWLLWKFFSYDTDEEFYRACREFITKLYYFLIYLGGAGLIYWISWETTDKSFLSIIGVLLVTYAVVKFTEYRYIGGFKSVPKKKEYTANLLIELLDIISSILSLT